MFDAKANTLLAVVQTGSYTKAAAKLNLTQPAVSHHIRQLEEEYGIKIFYKDRKELKPTPEGAVLVKYARRALAIHNSCKQAIEDCRSQIRRFTVAITPTAGENRIPQMLATYCSLYPHVHINVFTDTIQNIYNTLKSYEADIAVVEGQIDHPDFTSVLLDTDYLCLAVAPGHRLAGRSSVALPELKNEKFILRSRAAGTRTLFENYLMSHSESIRSLNVIMEMDSVATIKELVALGMGITVIAHSACREEELAGRLAVIPIENARMMREINMVHHKSFTHTEILEEFRRIYTAIQSGQPLAPAAEDAALV